MKRTISVCLAALVVAFAGQAQAGRIYTPHARHTRLGTIDPVTGAGTDIGSFEMPGFRLASGAFDSQGQFYSLAGSPDFNSQLAIVDTSTGAATPIGSPADMPLLPLEIDSNDAFYSVRAVFPEFNLGGEATLVTLDKSTGQVMPIGDTGVERAMDLALSSDGTLWVVGGADGGNQLFTIDTATGASTFQTEITGVAEATGVDGAEIMGIMFDENDALLATSFFGEEPDYVSPLFSIDTTTGAASVIGNTGFVLPHGGDYLIPEPASSTIALCCGILLLATAGRKRRISSPMQGGAE